MAVKSYTDIPGQFDFPRFYSHAVEKFNDGIFVEVGAWFGRSTAYLAQTIIDSRKSINFYVVDTWRGSVNERGLLQTAAEYGGSVYQKFLENMEAAGVLGVITPMEMLSVDAAAEFEDNSISMVFLDAEHTYEAVRTDILAWQPKVRPGGILAGHDYSLAWPGVKQAVDELLSGNKYNFTESSIWTSQK